MHQYLPLINENKHSDVDPKVLNLKWYGANTIQPQKVKPAYTRPAHITNRATLGKAPEKYIKHWILFVKKNSSTLTLP